MRLLTAHPQAHVVHAYDSADRLLTSSADWQIPVYLYNGSSAGSRGPYDGTIVGSPTFGSVKFGHGLTAVSNSNYITLPDFTASIQGATDSYTIDIWLQTSDTTHETSAFQWGPYSAAPYIGTNYGNVFFYFYGSGGFYSTPILYGGMIADGAVHHIRARMDAGSDARIFIDGVLSNHTTGSAYPFSNALPIIGRYTTGVYPWIGGIGEIAVFNTALGDGNDFTPPISEYTRSSSVFPAERASALAFKRPYLLDGFAAAMSARTLVEIGLCALAAIRPHGHAASGERPGSRCQTPASSSFFRPGIRPRLTLSPEAVLYR